MDINKLCINTIRMLSVDMIEEANSGHPGLPLGAAPMTYVLWTQFLKHNPANPKWHDRDRFVLSAGHGSALIYSLLHLTGYDLPIEEIKKFRQWESKTPGHPEFGHTNGVECTTGPLGQGFANGVGMAIAERFLSATFNRQGNEIVDHYTYSIVSDGDLMEGIASEAASLAGHLKLGKLIYLYDDNHISLAGETRLTFTEDVCKRFESYGWHVQKIEDGNDIDAISKAISIAKAETEKPSIISVRTIIGYGSPHKQDTFDAHGAPLGSDETSATKKNLGWPEDKKFFVPDDASKHFRNALEAGAKLEQEWKKKFESYTKVYPDLAKTFVQMMNGNLPDGWNKDVPVFKADPKGIATRAANSNVLNAIAPHLKSLVGGSADLDPSTMTAMKGRGTFQHSESGSDKLQGAVSGTWGYGGANIAYGVREHAMAGISNGIALHGGLLPYASTFLQFSDYMRPSIRLAALMNLQVLYIFTHDSIALGEDGPTHQPIEHFSSLRAIPNLTVIRPADANETAEAFKFAIEHKTGPTALMLTRQKVPVIDRSKFKEANGLIHGAYILADSANKPEIILVATGSEVHIALEAYEKMKAEGINVRVVSMPSWELFDKQPKKYRDEVLPPDIELRISVEAGTTLGWHKYIGLNGEAIGINHFGASAPGEKLLAEFGFTSENILNRVKKLMQIKKTKTTSCVCT